MQERVSTLSLENQKLCSALQFRGAKEKQTKRRLRRQRQKVRMLQSALVECREHLCGLGQRIDKILGSEDKTEVSEMESASEG